MTSARELADTAMELAREFLEHTHEPLLEMAQGDVSALHEAAQLVRTTRPNSPELTRSVEHMAFALLTQAFEETVREKRQP